MRAGLRIALDVVVRVAALLAVDLFFGWLVLDVISDAEDADIGGGILVMLLIAGAAGLIAAWDGWRSGLPRALLVWCLASLLGGAMLVVTPQLLDGELDLRVVDLVDPFWTLWVAVPACLGAVLGRTLPSRRRP
ncbi:hypothetical protein GCM10027062_16290 [Nocardioides hungaricus]